MSTWWHKTFRWLGALFFIVLMVVGVGGGWFYQQMQRSLPQLDGAALLPGLTAGVTIERDALGVPTITGTNRLDVAQALGWLHAQDRFFQMDLLRRRAAGELSALFGPKTLAADKTARLHNFRPLARDAVERLNPAERALLEAYSRGVNAGLQALKQSPAEYLMLRAEPQPWRVEDSILTAYAMALELHDEGNYERSLAAVRTVFGGEAADFFAPWLTDADAAFDGTMPETSPPIPSAQAVDLRRTPPADASPDISDEAPAGGGSNSFALSGAHTANGATLLANDMHLHLRVPNTWYRASLVWTTDTRAPSSGPAHKVTGVTLPGVPLIIAGSNGHVAWGLTNAYADTSDIVVIEPSVIARSLYKNNRELVPFQQRHETIEIKGRASVDYVVETTVWGPVIGSGEKTRPLVYHWTAHQPGAINLSLVDMEIARSVSEAVRVAHRAAMPAQNILIVDDQGHLAWTIAGTLPKRVGYDGRFPVSWTYGDRYWEGNVPAAEVPVFSNPSEGRLWTANNRIVGGPALEVLGDGGYDRPQRAARIRERLAGLERATPQDLLAIQLDDRAPILDRWHRLLLATLTPEAVQGNKARTKLRAQLADWDGRARIDSVSYRLVRLFRQQTANLVFNPIFAPCVIKFEEFSWHRFHYEQPLWTLLTAQPLHLLSPRYESWQELLLAAADKVVAGLSDQGVALDQATWGQRNQAQIRHPLSAVLPDWLSGWLNMPTDPLPGDSITPRVQRPDFGASERFVVSPGHEAEGLFEMPGGQSGHPLSPFYRAGHEAWVRGEPTPFLPGPTQYRLILSP